MLSSDYLNIVNVTITGAHKPKDVIHICEHFYNYKMSHNSPRLSLSQSLGDLGVT